MNEWTSAEPVVLCGPSVRALAHSALAAGFRVAAIDDYLDLDLVDRADWTERSPVDDADFEAIFRRRRPAAWCYGGGWENRPALIARLAALAPLWGTNAENLPAVRDPFIWSEALTERGFAVPGIRSHDESPRILAESATSPRRWLSKRLAGANGGHVRWTSETGLDDDDGLRVLQEFVPGRVESAQYVARPDGVALLGLCAQMIGEADLGASGFGYAGAVGPLPLDDVEAEFFATLGQAIAALGPLRGLFGVDGVRRPDGRWIPIEINPRYTASMEALERATGRACFAEHAAAFGAIVPDRARVPSIDRRVVGKGIVFARETMELSFDRRDWREFEATFPDVRLADLPCPGTIVRAGEPTLTLLVEGTDVDETVRRVRSIGVRVDAELRRRFARAIQ